MCFVFLVDWPRYLLVLSLIHLYKKCHLGENSTASQHSRGLLSGYCLGYSLRSWQLRLITFVTLSCLSSVSEVPNKLLSGWIKVSCIDCIWFLVVSFFCRGEKIFLFLLRIEIHEFGTKFKREKRCREKNAFFLFLPGSWRVHIRLISIPGALCLLWDAGLAWVMLPGHPSYQSMSGHVTGSRLEVKDFWKECDLGLELWL